MKLYHSDRRLSFSGAINTYPPTLQMDAVRPYLKVPEVVTEHGARYLLGPSDSVPIEFVWELVRQQEFPEQPSRLSSTFCFKDATAAALFGKHNSDHGQGVVWEIEADDDTAYFDMRWLDHNTSFVTMITHARSYWRREVTSSPILEYLVQPADATVIGKLPSSNP